MTFLEIKEVSDTGELRWGVRLFDDEGLPRLKTITPLAKGDALSTAKALKNKGPDAPLLWDGPGEEDRPAWIAEKTR